MHHLFPSHDVLPTNLGSTTKFQAWKFSKGLQSKTPGKKVGTFSGGQIKRWTLRCCIPCKRSEELPRFPAKYDPFLVTLPHLWRFFAPGILLKPRVAAKRIAGVLSWKSHQSAAFQRLNESSRSPKEKTPVLSWNFHGFFLSKTEKRFTQQPPFPPPHLVGGVFFNRSYAPFNCTLARSNSAMVAASRINRDTWWRLQQSWRNSLVSIHSCHWNLIMGPYKSILLGWVDDHANFIWK